MMLVFLAWVMVVVVVVVVVVGLGIHIVSIISCQIRPHKVLLYRCRYCNRFNTESIQTAIQTAMQTAKQY